MTPEQPLFVSVSHVRAAPDGADVLAAAFVDRLGEGLDRYLLIAR